MKEIRSSRSIAFIGMLGALSAVLMLISVPLPFAPGFLKFDIAELPALFAGFFLGPVGGCAVIIVKILLKLVDDFGTARDAEGRAVCNLDFLYDTEFDIRQYLLAHERKK